MRIETAASGAPIARVPTEPAVHVSISHREGSAVAVAARGERVGLDLESIEPRSEAFAQDWFTEAERSALGGDDRRLTIAWSAKEAVQKVLGLGMAVSPREIEVVEIAPEGRVTVRLVGRAAQAHAELGGYAISLQWADEPLGGAVRVEARMAA